jgi:separase
LLDLACSTTLSRELLEAIDQKLRDTATHDDLLWPSMDQKGSPAPQRQDSGRPTILCFDNTEDDEPEDQEMLTYWTSVRDRYRARTVDASISSESDINRLPDNWMVVHIAVNEAKDTLVMSRQRPNQTPLAFCVPLARTSRKENDAINSQLTFDAAVQELKDIIELNTATSKRAASLQSQCREARAAWWAERGALDTRLKELLENIEFCWLGAFKVWCPLPLLVSAEDPPRFSLLNRSMSAKT